MKHSFLLVIKNTNISNYQDNRRCTVVTNEQRPKMKNNYGSNPSTLPIKSF